MLCQDVSSKRETVSDLKNYSSTASHTSDVFTVPAVLLIPFMIEQIVSSSEFYSNFTKWQANKIPENDCWALLKRFSLSLKAVQKCLERRFDIE